MSLRYAFIFPYVRVYVCMYVYVYVCVCIYVCVPLNRFVFNVLCTLKVVRKFSCFSLSFFPML